MATVYHTTSKNSIEQQTKLFFPRHEIPVVTAATVAAAAAAAAVPTLHGGNQIEKCLPNSINQKLLKWQTCSVVVVVVRMC